MRYRYLPATIMLAAGAITIFICMYKRYETLYSLKLLLAVLVIFLIIGSLTKSALIRIINMGNGVNQSANTTVKSVEEENKEEDSSENDDDKKD